tara:strand:+ start:418 stop:1098 length:681 start_codon:yes stop_codon:yes gene_type:complete
MKNLYIVYGSETKLLKGLFEFEDSYFIRIYNKNKPNYLHNASDVNGFEEFKATFNEIIKKNDPQRIIFIGAAFLTQNTLFLLEKENSIEKILEVNITNYVQYTHYILPFMKKLKSGQFIYLSSFRSTHTARGISLYSASKAFGEKFFEIIGKENGAFGVFSSSIRMGYFDGRMTNVMGTKKIKDFELSTGNRRLGKEKDLINCIKYILENDYTNGGVVDLSGGISF